MTTGLADHPAVRAWLKLGANPATPEAIQVLKKEDENDFRCELYDAPQQGIGRSAVYRLFGVGREGGAVIAKQGESAAPERMIYETVLSHLPVRSLRYYGSATDDTNGWWLFMEDAGEENYSSDSAVHRVIAGRWLGALHRSVQGFAGAESLPDRGPSFYLERLRRARAMISKINRHPAPLANHRSTLNAIIGHCDRLEKLWPRIERLCTPMPRTLVHGDLATRNVRIRPHENEATLLVLDWETAGWGVPAADLTQFALESVTPDVAAYWSTVESAWTHLGLDYLREIANLGRVFRVIAALCWANDGFHPRSLEWYMEDMRWYELELWDWLRTGGLS